MTTTTDAYLNELYDLLGAPTVESPPHSNMTSVGRRYGWNGVAWCAETQSIVCLDVFGHKVLWTASVDQARSMAKAGENGMVWHDRDADIKVCFLSCFDFGGRGNPADFHISCVVNPATQAKFETIGGNEGDAVRRQWRDRKYIIGFIELPFDSVGLTTTPDEGELMAVADLVQELHNAVFDGSAAQPGPNGIQARLARVEADQQTFAGTSNGFFAAIIAKLGDENNGILGSTHIARKLVKAILKRDGATDKDIKDIEDS